MLKLISIFVMLTSTLSVQSQSCDNYLTEEERSIALDLVENGFYNISSFDETTTLQEPRQVRIKWHLLCSETDCPISHEELEYYLNGLNDAFHPIRIKFIADPIIHYIDDNDLAEEGSDINGIRRMSSLEGAINVYWGKSFGGGNLCGASSFTFMPFQGIIMQTTCQGNEDVLGVFIHEVGHYFDLFHTHEFECPSGINCDIMGDYVCDTAPSTSLRFDYCIDSSTCMMWEDVHSRCYEAPPLEACPEGIDYDPDLENYMSYTAVPCLQEFSQGQYDRAAATYFNLRQELHHIPIPQCVGDLSGDGVINGEDLSILLASWGEAAGDLTGDGFTDGADLAVMLAKWGGC